MVAGSIEQMEKNVSASFGYVKKDILMVNDAISDLHDKIQHLSLNQAMLLEKVSNVEKLLTAKPAKAKKAKKKLKFYDLKTKTSFETDSYQLKTIKGKRFAIAKSPEGNKAYRIMGGKTTAKKASKKKPVKKVSKKTKKTITKNPKKIVTETVLYE